MSIRGDAQGIEQVASEIEELTNNRQGSGGYDRPREPPKPMETTPAPTDFVCIDWQAAARESVSYKHCITNRSIFNCIFLDSNIKEEENKKRWARLPPLKKNFYVEHPDVTNMSPEKVASIREQNNNTTVDRLLTDDKVDCTPVPNPIEKFEQCWSEYPDLLGEPKRNIFCLLSL